MQKIIESGGEELVRLHPYNEDGKKKPSFLSSMAGKERTSALSNSRGESGREHVKKTSTCSIKDALRASSGKKQHAGILGKCQRNTSIRPRGAY